MAESSASPVPLTHEQILVVFSGLLLAMLLAALDSTIVATALPTIVGELGGLERLAWVVTAYLLAQTVVTPLYGKLGDLYGRKIVLQSAIVLFLIGSVLCALSATMTQLIVFRAIQGMGGGGLMVTTQAVVGDIVPPRDRGRYQGIFGAVFGISSIAGPLIGGYFTTHLTWRWIFYINVPLGLLALAVIAFTLPKRAERLKHRIDYLGVALLASALSAMVLFTDLGGVTYPWSSAPMIALGVGAVLALAAFVLVERRASEPVLPLGLFANRTFTLSAAIGLIVGFALFGSVTYIPLFLQVVKGATPTASGLQMLPLMGGMLLTSIVSGQMISKWGRYKIFPLIGTAVMSLGLFMLSRMHVETSVVIASLNMLVLGMGLGLVMQVLVIAVQNAVEYRDLGVATSGATLFRLIGGSLGTAAFGAIFAGRLASHLRETLPAGVGIPEGAGIGPQAIAELPRQIKVIYLQAFTTSLGTVFLAAAVIAFVAFALTWLLPERPLRESIAATAGDVGREAEGVFPLPTDADSTERLERSLSLIASRDTKRAYIQRVVARSGVDLAPFDAWVLVRFAENETRGLKHVAEIYGVDLTRAETAFARLEDAGLVRDDQITARGRSTLAELARARREHLMEVVAEWGPERRSEMEAAVLRVMEK